MLALQEEELTRKVGPCPAAGLPSLGVVGGMLLRPLNSSLWTAGPEGQRSPVPASLEDPPSSSSVQIQPLDPLEPEFPKKCRSLLRSWREKVFALMVQLKAQDLEHRDSMTQLKDQVRGCVSVVGPHPVSRMLMTVSLGVGVTRRAQSPELRSPWSHGA